MKAPEPRDSLLALLLTSIFILVTTVFTEAQNVFSFRQLLFGLVLTITILTICIGLALAFSRSHRHTELEEIMSQLKEIVPRTDFPWLYKDHDLARAESKARGDNIWIISPDLVNVTEKQVITNAVRKNIKRGITYTYVVPDADQIEGSACVGAGFRITS